MGSSGHGRKSQRAETIGKVIAPTRIAVVERVRKIVAAGDF
jgi:hypothetical protein